MVGLCDARVAQRAVFAAGGLGIAAGAAGVVGAEEDVVVGVGVDVFGVCGWGYVVGAGGDAEVGEVVGEAEEEGDREEEGGWKEGVG